MKCINSRILKIVIVCVCCVLAIGSATGGYAQTETGLSSVDSSDASAGAETDAAAAEPIVGKLYGIGSVSKVYTAAAVMKLVDQGKIDLDEQLTTYIPEFEMADERYVNITPRMLLNHSPGFMGSTFINATLLGDNDTYNHDNFLKLLKTQKLSHDPGDRSVYCNDASTMAEILVERVSGMGFTEFVEREFLKPLGLENTKTPQSDFNWDILADTYMGSNQLKPENYNLIGSGGMYASMEDLCRYAAIFMDSADGSILSKESVDEMAKNQHRKEVVPADSETMFKYGLGWDSVETYPYSAYGIKALSKGGSTETYHTILNVLPEYDIAAAVSSSGISGSEQLLAQEIILAVLIEEGLIQDDMIQSLPEQNLERAKIPESLKHNAGIYGAGFLGVYMVRFFEDSMTLTPIGVKNELPHTYIYNTDGEFISTNGDFFSMSYGNKNVRGVTRLNFTQEGYITIQTYEQHQGLGVTALAMPAMEKIDDFAVIDSAQAAWDARSGREYLLVSEKFTSSMYRVGLNFKPMTDDRVPGHVSSGIYESRGKDIPLTKILDGNTAVGFQNIPTMPGRDNLDLYAYTSGGHEYISINNNWIYIDASGCGKFSDLGENVTIGGKVSFGDSIVTGAETIWVDIDEESAGKTVSILAPENGSWFVYDSKMNCVATSLEKNPRDKVVLPDNGRLAFAGEPGAVFLIR